MKTTSIRIDIARKFGCNKPAINLRGKIIVVTMPFHCISQTRAEVQELANRFAPIKMRGNNVVIRGRHSEEAQCLADIDDLNPTTKTVDFKPKFRNQVNATA